MDEAELDREWKPSRRPQSTMALSFSAALNDIFMIDNSLDHLSQSVAQKKRAVSTQTEELEALEAQLRQTEDLLKQKRASFSLQARGARPPPHRRMPLAGVVGGEEGKGEEEEAQAEPAAAPERPATAVRTPEGGEGGVGAADGASRHDSRPGTRDAP
ncbi:MAG: hypothetical protein M1829_003286 [Trizodia sp. TS-e1964]|nr:MAG: hypothetical protein M1829_003286 [Trizodia sp. TS-e1964]